MFSYVFDYIPLTIRNKGHGKVFVAHNYGVKVHDDLRNTIRRAFEPELTPYHADLELGPHHLLIKIAARIETCRLFVCDLSKPSSSVMIELGLALARNKPIIVCAHSGYSRPKFLDGVNIIEYESYRDLGRRLEDRKYQALQTAIASPRTGWCQLCNQSCRARLRPPSESGNTAFIVDESSESRHQEDFRGALTKALDSTGLRGLTFEDAEFLEVRTLCGLVSMMLDSRLALFRFVESVAPVTLFLFGLSFGLRVPPVVLVEHSPDAVPSVLGGFDRVEYQDFDQLADILPSQLTQLLEPVNALPRMREWQKFDYKAIEALTQISSFLSQVPNYEDKIEAALILGLYAIRSSAGSLMLLSQDRLKITAMVAPLIEMDAVGEWSEFGTNEGICGLVFQTGRPYWTGDVGSDPNYEKRTFDRNLMSLGCVPVKSETGKVLGVINADSREPDFFRKTDIEVLQAVAKLIAPVIEGEGHLASKHEDGETTTASLVQNQLLRGPVCLNCDEPALTLTFRRLEDDRGLRYRMLSKCIACSVEEDIRTYMIQPG